MSPFRRGRSATTSYSVDQRYPTKSKGVPVRARAARREGCLSNACAFAPRRTRTCHHATRLDADAYADYSTATRPVGAWRAAVPPPSFAASTGCGLACKSCTSAYVAASRAVLNSLCKTIGFPVTRWTSCIGFCIVTVAAKIMPKLWAGVISAAHNEAKTITTVALSNDHAIVITFSGWHETCFALFSWRETIPLLLSASAWMYRTRCYG